VQPLSSLLFSVMHSSKRLPGLRTVFSPSIDHHCHAHACMVSVKEHRGEVAEVWLSGDRKDMPWASQSRSIMQIQAIDLLHSRSPQHLTGLLHCCACAPAGIGPELVALLTQDGKAQGGRL
jgi:thiamine biosynthesis protein ThiC